MCYKAISEQELRSITCVLGETDSILSKANLKELIIQEKLCIADDGYRSNRYVYQLGFNKRDWLYNCFAEVVGLGVFQNLSEILWEWGWATSQV